MHDLIRSGELVNIAAIKTRTKALGPGLRAGVWFQGCPFNCTGCISPAWIEKRDAYLIRTDVLAEYIVNDPDLVGVTLSGGEPFYQPQSLNSLIEIILKERPELTVIVFTGFSIEQLKRLPIDYKISESLSMIDILIDGLFIQSKNLNIGLRGSSNQRVHRLTGRMAEIDFEEMPRINEIYFENGTFQISGVPDVRISQLVSIQEVLKKEVHYVRT